MSLADDLREALAARAAAKAAVLALYDDIEEHYDLRVRPNDEPADILQALSLLDSDAPLADTFPDGVRASGPFTPRQVILLANAFQRPITHEDARYQEALTKIHDFLGRHAPRTCGGMTKEGFACGNYALPYVRIPRCHHHAAKADVKHNSDQRRREQELLRHELAKITAG